jgi:hypothetical protein
VPHNEHRSGIRRYETHRQQHPVAPAKNVAVSDQRYSFANSYLTRDGKRQTASDIIPHPALRSNCALRAYHTRRSRLLQAGTNRL